MQAGTGEFAVKEKRPHLATLCESLADCEKWRRQIMTEISKSVRRPTRCPPSPLFNPLSAERPLLLLITALLPPVFPTVLGAPPPPLPLLACRAPDKAGFFSAIGDSPARRSTAAGRPNLGYYVHTT